MSKEKSTESKSEGFKWLMKEAKVLEHTLQEKRRKQNRRDLIVPVVVSGVFALLLVVDLLTHRYANIFFLLAIWPWVTLNYLKDKTINSQRYIIDMLTGLRELENKAYELETKAYEIDVAKVKKGKK